MPYRSPATIPSTRTNDSRPRLTDKRSQRFKVLQIRARIVVRRFEDERGVRKVRVPREAPQSFTADVAFANVPVPIYARGVRRSGSVEMHRAHLLQTNRASDHLH